MTNSEETAKQPDEEKAAEEKQFTHNGLVRGIPGKRLVINGVLDLRGVPVEEVAGIRSLVVNGVVLTDEHNRSGLTDVRSVVNGVVVEAGPDLRVIIESDVEFSKGAVEAMPGGQKLMLIGNVFIRPEVPPALIAEKFEQLHVIGILIACEGVYGALLGKMEKTGVSITLPDHAAHVVRSTGRETWTQEYLQRLPDGTTYVTVGKTTVPKDIPEELVSRKIAAYYNVGKTEASEPVLSLLKSRCPTNLGKFSAPEDD